MDMTLLYYTANRISESFANKVREYLIKAACGKPIISISQKPINFGTNICVGDIGYTARNVYKQILIGAKESTTKYVSCCEDDTLYVASHFDYIPEEDAFYYNRNRWNLKKGNFYFRRLGVNMCACVAPTSLMVSTLEERFKKLEEVGNLSHMGEPGRRERAMGLTRVKLVNFYTDKPIIQINHSSSLGGSRGRLSTDIFEKEIPEWGNGSELWRNLWT